MEETILVEGYLDLMNCCYMFGMVEGKILGRNFCGIDNMVWWYWNNSIIKVT